jgi:hypothetical protein
MVLKPSIMASRAEASQQTLVMVPATSTVSMERLRSSSGSSLAPGKKAL